MTGEAGLSNEQNNRQEDEISLVNRLRSGDEVAFNQLFDRYHLTVYNICYRFTRNCADAQDLTQEVFVKIYKKIKTYNFKAKFSTWLYRVTLNHCISFRRKEKTAGPIEPTRGDSDFKERVELKRAIDQAMIKLPKQQRMVFILRHFNQFSFDEIAEILKISTGAVKAHHHFAVLKMKESLINLGY